MGGASGQNWAPDSSIMTINTPVYPTSSSAMTVLNNYDFGGSEISIFFAYHTGSEYVLRYLTHNDGNFELAAWQPSNAMTASGNSVVYMTSAVWNNPSGGWAYAVFWSGTGGGIWMAYNVNNQWTFGGAISGVSVSGGKHFTAGVAVNNGQLTIDIFTENNVHYQQTGPLINMNGFIRVGSFITDNTSMEEMAGEMLSYSSGSYRFYSINNGHLTESMDNEGQYVGNNQQFTSFSTVLTGSVATIATSSFASTPAQAAFVNVFALVNNNGATGIQGTAWSSATNAWTQPFTVASTLPQ